MKNEYGEIARVIREWRMKRGFSQLDLAKKLSISPALMNQFEKGVRKPELIDAFRMEMILELEDEPISQLVIGNIYRAAAAREGSTTFLKPRVGPTTGKGGVETESQLKLGEEAKVISVPVKMPKEIYLKLEFQ